MDILSDRLRRKSKNFSTRSGRDSGYYSTMSSAEILSSHRKSQSGTEKNTLPSPLSIERRSEESDSRTNSAVYYTKDGRDIIPEAVVVGIAQKLRNQVSEMYVDLHAFAYEHDVGFESLQRIIEVHAGLDWPVVTIDVDDHSFLCSESLADDVKTRIETAMNLAGSDYCDLTTRVGHGISSVIVLALASELTNEKGGEISLAGHHVIYTPACRSCEDKQRIDRERTERIAELVQRVERIGFCIAPGPSESTWPLGPSDDMFGDDDDLSQAASVYEKTHPGRRLTLVTSILPEGTTKALIEPEILHEVLNVLKLAAALGAEEEWQRNPNSTMSPSSIVQMLDPSEFSNPNKVELANIILHSEYAHDLEATAAQRVSELDSDKQNRFVQIFEDLLWGPIHLYAAGLMSTEDQVVRKDLEVSATERLARENIPKSIAAASQQGLLEDRSRVAAMDKLYQVKTFAELQIAVAEAGSSLNIDKPCDDLVMQVKLHTLQQTVDSIKRLTRGLDVLQTLLWVLLATSGPGLFVSSIRYTSRMIKQYHDVGDPEISGLLSLWWEKVSGGTADAEDIRQMKELAREAITMWKEGEFDTRR